MERKNDQVIIERIANGQQLNNKPTTREKERLDLWSIRIN